MLRKIYKQIKKILLFNNRNKSIKNTCRVLPRRRPILIAHIYWTTGTDITFALLLLKWCFLNICCLATGVVSLFTSWSLPGNGATHENMYSIFQFGAHLSPLHPSHGNFKSPVPYIFTIWWEWMSLQM
jgi:hypothetical protein